MATAFAIPALNRLAWHLDSRIVKIGVGYKTTWDNFTTTEKGNLNKEVSGSYYAPVVANGYIYVIAPFNTFTGYLLEVSSGPAPKIQVTTVATPVHASEWKTIEDAATLQDATTYRTPHVLATAQTNVTGIRFKFSTAAHVKALHLYGELERDLQIQNLGGTAHPTPASVSFGMTAPQSGKPLSFRVYNRTDANRTIQISLIDSTPVTSGQELSDQLWWSTDGRRYERYATQFSVGVTFKTLGDPIYLRRYVLSSHQNDTPWTLILKIASDDFADFVYVYMDDVVEDATRNTPVLYHLDSRTLVPNADTYTLITNVYTSDVRLIVTQAPKEAYLISSVDGPTLVAAVADPRVIDPLINRYDVAHYVTTFTVNTNHWLAGWERKLLGPSVLVMIGSVTDPVDGAITYQSNGLSVTLAQAVVEQPPVGTALRLVAVTHDGEILSASVPYISLSATGELSDVGAGKLILNFDAPYWKEDVETDLTPEFVATREFIWEAWEGGYLRMAWLNTVSVDKPISTDLSRIVTISGPGLAHALTWSMVLPPSYPESTSPYWSFVQARLWQWLTIWASCVQRTPETSLQRQLLPLFTRYYDAAGNYWLDEGFELQQENGVNMLELLMSHCAATKCDFIVRPDRKIDVRYSRAATNETGLFFGKDLTEVIFYPTLTQLQEISYDRSDIGNFVVARDDYGVMSTKFDGDSIIKHGMRERYVAAGRAGTASSRDTQAQEQLTWYSDQLVAWTLSVAPYYLTDDDVPYNRVFVDYEVGDWIYVKVSGTDTPVSLQINAITVQQGSDGNYEVELTLETLVSLVRRKTQKISSTAGSSSSSGSIGNLLPNEEIFLMDDPVTEVGVKYKPWPMSEAVTLGMHKYMEIDGAGTLGVRQFTRFLQRGVDWKREGWTVKILDPTVFDEAVAVVDPEDEADA